MTRATRKLFLVRFSCCKLLQFEAISSVLHIASELQLQTVLSGAVSYVGNQAATSLSMLVPGSRAVPTALHQPTAPQLQTVLHGLMKCNRLVPDSTCAA